MDYKYPTPQLLFKAICNAIRSKTGNSDEIPHQNIPDELDGINMIKNECTNLIEIINGNAEMFSNYITTIGSGRFYANANLTTVNLPECTSIASNAFTNCTNLTTINFPKCTTIGRSAFEGCTNLMAVYLPECTSIDDNAFHSCNNLIIMNLPECTSIGDYAFYNCSGLITLILRANQVVNISSRSLGNVPATYNEGNIYVPDNLVDSYKTATNWSRCRIKPLSSLTAIIFNTDQIITNTNILKGTPIENGIGYIYVPDNLVDSYKIAANWSTYADQIKPRSEMPSELKEEYGFGY